MVFNWRIFVVGFVFGLVIGALSNVSQFLFRMFDNLTPQMFSWITSVISVATFFISPVLLFACLYIMGEKIDLVTEFLSVVVPLFLGTWAGHLIGYFPLQFILIAWNGGTFAGPWVFWFMWYAFRAAFSLEFFVGFAALSMAYIARRRSL